MPSPSKRVFFSDYIFDVSENVYEPAEDSFLFAENLVVKEGETVVDVGTGCGILGVVAAKKAREVIAIDINPYAVRCARENAYLNHVTNRVFCIQGNLFAPLGNEVKFDLVLFNAPYLPSERAEGVAWLWRAWDGGVTGRQIIDLFVCEAPTHLKSNGRIFLMQSTLSDVDETMHKLEGWNLTVNIAAKQALPFFETMVLVKAESK